MAIQKISVEMQEAIKRKSAYALPDRPSDQGVKADEIKKALWSPVVDSANSVISEINRIVEEINIALDAVPEAYILPTASQFTLGGVKAKTIVEGQGYNEVHINDDGMLYAPKEVPTPSAAYNGKILAVQNGAYAFIEPEEGGGGSSVPTPTTLDNGKILGVVNGEYALVNSASVSATDNSAGGTTYTIETGGGA